LVLHLVRVSNLALMVTQAPLKRFLLLCIVISVPPICALDCSLKKVHSILKSTKSSHRWFLQMRTFVNIIYSLSFWGQNGLPKQTPELFLYLTRNPPVQRPHCPAKTWPCSENYASRFRRFSAESSSTSAAASCTTRSAATWSRPWQSRAGQSTSAGAVRRGQRGNSGSRFRRERDCSCRGSVYLSTNPWCLHSLSSWRWPGMCGSPPSLRRWKF